MSFFKTRQIIIDNRDKHVIDEYKSGKSKTATMFDALLEDIKNNERLINR